MTAPEQCEHPWWHGVAAWLAGFAFVCMVFGAGWLSCGVMVRAYTWAAGD